MSATDIRPAELALSPPYDLLLVSGLLIYLNDSDCQELLRQALQLCAPGGRIYLREPVAVEQRLTLDRFFSKELEHEYSAVYRTVAELKDMLVQAGGGEGPAILEEDGLFAEALEKRAETRQYFMILQRRG